MRADDLDNSKGAFELVGKLPVTIVLDGEISGV